MGISRRFLKLVAEKNLLKLVLTNRQTTLQVVHNRSGNVFLQARRAARAVKLSPARRRPPSGRGQATSLEKAVRDRLPDNAPGSDRRAAAAAAEVLAERAHDLGLTRLTWERAGFRRGPGDHGKARYIAGSKVAVVIDTLRRKGISFISHVNARGSPARVRAAGEGSGVNATFCRRAVDMAPILERARMLSHKKHESMHAVGAKLWPSQRLLQPPPPVGAVADP